MKFATLAVHAGASPDPGTAAVAPPIHLSTTFEHGAAGQRLHGHMYIRESNPTQDRLEIALAAIEGGKAAAVFASGLAAVTAFFQALPRGSHVLIADDVYYGVRMIASDFFAQWGLEWSLAAMDEPQTVQRLVRPNTKLLWGETPSNPLMRIVDVAALAEIAHAAGAQLAIDNTFATPVLQRPLELGADVVMHSTTKYFGGHSDVQGGALIVKNQGPLHEALLHIRHTTGGVASPFNSWLVLRGIRSLACRVERQTTTALALARFLETQPAIETVYYPGLESHPGHGVAKAQMKAFGGMLSFGVKGGRERATAVASRVKLFVCATSLGGTESLIEHRASSEGPTSTTPENLLRVSAGLEDPEDLIDDLRQALG